MSQTALEFDGVNDFVDCGNDPSLDITGTAITLEAWIYPTSFQPNIWQGNVINKGDISQTGYMLRVGGAGQVNFNFGSFGAWNELNSGAGVLILNSWQHIAATYDGVTSRIYVNGIEVAITNHTASIASANQPLYLGEDPEYNGRFFPGRIDEARVWNVTRTASEILNGMSNEICNTSAELVAYYRFNDGINGGNNLGQNTLTDDSGYGNDGTLNNFANVGATSNWALGYTLGPGMTSTIVPIDACDNYTWTQNGQTYTTSGNYSVLLTGSAGCDSTVILDLNIFSPNNLTTNQTVCDSFVWNVNGQTYYASTSITETLTTSQGCLYDHTLNLNVNNSFDTVLLVYDECPPYVWSVNGVSYDSSGTYLANFTNAQGCDSTYQLNLVIYDNAVADVTQNGDGSFSTSWPFDIQWMDCSTNTAIAGAIGPTFVPTSNGDFALIAYGPNWCPDTSACFTVEDLSINSLAMVDFDVYPNPSNGDIFVEFSEAWKSGNLEITDIRGQVIFSKFWRDETEMKVVIIASPGVYFVRIKTEEGRQAVRRLILE